jgi:malate synthase
MAKSPSVQTAKVDGRAQDILLPDALTFIAGLERQFGSRREALLRERVERQAQFDGGELPGFPADSERIRDGEWQVAPVPDELLDRRCEITAPVERKMLINAANSGARVFMADFEDANSPTWANVIGGQVNLIDLVDGTIEYKSPEGRQYRLHEKTAVLMVRPRGWHLVEKHIIVDGQAISASLADFGLFLFHNGNRLLDRGSGPYFYLPKLEGRSEARLWDDVFTYTEQALGFDHGTIKATVLVETILATFEMEEILYDLRDHSAGLNAGRWDYIFSIIKKLGGRREFVLPDRNQVTMDVPFMQAYTRRLVDVCHRRGALAIGGMAAYIPNRSDEELNAQALMKVRQDKQLEAATGFDGCWVAHPDLVSTVTAVFDTVLGSIPNQVHRTLGDAPASAEQLLDVAVPGAAITEAGLRNDISVALQYLESWLRGNGAVAIRNLMEDTATAEIARSQVWQWAVHEIELDSGQQVNAECVLGMVDEELAKLEQPGQRGRRWGAARSLFERITLTRDFVEFLTLPGSEMLE